jgi:hypothetical protein
MRGYCFELTIFRDLQATGIEFVAHDLTKRAERRAPCDMVVSRRVGDVKNTTYFLHAAYTRALNCDFYITRLYHTRRRRYVSIVVMTEAGWDFWNGDVMQIPFDGSKFVIATYDLWKEKVKSQQQRESGEM